MSKKYAPRLNYEKLKEHLLDSNLANDPQGFTVSQAAKFLRVQHQIANNIIDQLVIERLLKGIKHTDARGTRFYIDNNRKPEILHKRWRNPMPGDWDRFNPRMC